LQTQSCDQYACGADICLGNCTLDTDCIAGEHCSAGICVANVPTGTACASGTQCASGFCADGVCCDQACTGQCQACALAGQAGTCGTVIGAAPRAGRPACAGSGACQGICDGTSATVCAMPGPTILCGQSKCANGAETTPGTCDGLGTCAGGQPRSCGQFQCDVTACKTTCASALDCIASASCAAGACVPASTFDAGLPGLDASPADAASQPNNAGPAGFHVVGGGCKCNLGAKPWAKSPAWLAALALGALVARRRRR
jgi:MYXO-CTERM domain-containing protein